MPTGLSPWCWGLHTHPADGTCSLPLPRSSASIGQRNQMAGGDQSVEGQERNQPKVRSQCQEDKQSQAVLAADLCSPGWSALTPCCHLPRELTLTRPALPKQNLHKSPDFSPIIWILWCRCLSAPNRKVRLPKQPDSFFTLILVNYDWATWDHGATNQDNSGSLIHASSALSCYQLVTWHKQTTAGPSSSWRQRMPCKRYKSRSDMRSCRREGSAKHFPRLVKSSAQLQEGGRWQPSWQLAHPHCRRMWRWKFLSRVGTQILLDTRSHKICNSELGENKEVLWFF